MLRKIRTLSEAALRDETPLDASLTCESKDTYLYCIYCIYVMWKNLCDVRRKSRTEFPLYGKLTHRIRGKETRHLMLDSLNFICVNKYIYILFPLNILRFQEIQFAYLIKKLRKHLHIILYVLLIEDKNIIQIILRLNLSIF